MSGLMEFWGVEVKSGQPLKINPGDNKIVHLSQASLGEVKKDKGRESVLLYLNVDDKKLVLGTLSAQKFPQLNFDLVIEKDFELSHNGKNESVYFTGYKLRMEEGTDDDDDSESDKDVKKIQLSNGKPDLRAKTSLENPNAVKPSASTAKQNMKDVKPNQKADDSDSDDSDLNASSSDDDETLNLVNHKSGSDESSGELDESDDDEDDEGTDESDSDDEDEETPKKAEPSKKRPTESATKALVPDKKAKFITPEKTEGRKGVSHAATPHPSKKSGKTPANSDQTKQQPKKSGGSFPCKSCNRSFTTEGGLQSHTKAKHSDAA